MATSRLRTNRIVTSPVSGKRYRLRQRLGEGGYATAYLAEELSRRGAVLREVCFKVSEDQASWHREAYFGELLSGNRRVIQTWDSFPMHRQSGMLFCLVLELAEFGTIADYLRLKQKPWTEKRAVRECNALLKMLDQLHGGNATHRDITPMNIFVCANGTLKLGDFGIARHELAGKPVAIEAFNPEFVTRGFLESRHKHWLSVDDVFQMGQLLGVLLTGDPDTTITSRTLRKVDASDRVKAVIRRAIGPRTRRYADAWEMRQALLGDEAAPSTVSSCDGKTLVFTGPLSIKRFDAEVLAMQAGGLVAKKVSKGVDIVVQGGRSQHYRSGGHKGSKLQQAQQLIKQGHEIAIIGEAEFRGLVRQDAA